MLIVSTLKASFTSALALCSLGLALAAPELGVTHISRTPLYWRYNVQYANGVPFLAPTHNGQNPLLDKHWPDPGEQVTFTAHVKNHGSTSVAFWQYRWAIDGVPQGAIQTANTPLAPGQSADVTFAWTWPANLSDHTVTIEVDPNQMLTDNLRQNNTYTDHTNALSFSIWIEQGLYDLFKTRLNGFGTYGFEDWFRWQFDEMRACFARSVYPVLAPSGIVERIRLDKIVVVPFDVNNLNNWIDAMGADPHELLNDGRWQFTNYENTLPAKQAQWQFYLDLFAQQYDYGLIHEMTHQLGMVDGYRMNLETHQNDVLRQDGTRLNTRHIFSKGGLMGGGNVLNTSEVVFESHVAAAMNRNLHYRRGYYGEYMFDTPLQTYVQVFDIRGNALPGARLDFYQKNDSEVITNLPTFTVNTDTSGRALLPNRSVSGTTTATGHTLRANPFGHVDVVARTNSMLVKITKGTQEDFRWFEIVQLNEAYWAGQQSQTTIRFDSKIIMNGRVVPEFEIQNIARGKPATASSNVGMANKANDGNTLDPSSAWPPDPPLAGQWWQVDLGKKETIARAIIYGFAGNPHDWYAQFHLEVSNTGSFQGEQTVVPLETNWDESRTMGDYTLQRLTGLENRVEYTFHPVTGRYVRVVSDVAQNWVQLQELELYRLNLLPIRR
ncbi:MAG: discoidin domain-containing protein [Fimbriimonadaceae bacterium]|nr:discoidin domain-containing protein [Fimbriimonadaceae bacterium]